jgi:hypothetical protein
MLRLKYWQYWWSGNHLINAVEKRGQTKMMLREMGLTHAPATELMLGLYAIRRAETRTGADYYVAPLDHTSEDLEDCYRLEVSGTNADEQEVRRRLGNKVRQAQHGQSNLPALAVVVGFRVKLIFMQAVEALL